MRLVDPAFDENKRFLGTLNRIKRDEDQGEDVDPYPHYVADLYNNAMRRGDVEKKHDDAVAKLYRIIELLAQQRLKKKYNIDTSNVSSNDLPKALREEWGDRMREGKIKIGLQDAYRLLNELGDEIARARKYFFIPNFLVVFCCRDIFLLRDSYIVCHFIVFQYLFRCSIRRLDSS